MISLRSRSGARIEPDRLRFAGGGQILIFGLTVLLILLLVFPGQILHRRLEHTETSDSLTVAYLLAWLKAKPEDNHLRLQLARHLLATGQADRAWDTLQPLLAAPPLDDRDRYRAELLHLDLLERRLWREKPGSLAFMHLQGDYMTVLRALAANPQFEDRLVWFAGRAEAMGDASLARALYFRLLTSGEPRRLDWYLQIARLARAEGNTAMAGRVLMTALDLTERPEHRQQLLMQALRDLQAANRLEEALRMAELHLGPSAHDPAVLEFLARLALAANRPDLAQGYVARLLNQRVSPGGRP